MQLNLAVGMIVLFLNGNASVYGSNSDRDRRSNSNPESSDGIISHIAANEYIEYHASSGLDVILSAPHGGWLLPNEVPDREAGCWNETSGSCVWNHNCGLKNDTKCKAITDGDWNTFNLTTEIRDHLCTIFDGRCPAAILNRLSRKKFDANREIHEATFDVPAVVSAFQVYHRFIDAEEQRISERTGGLFVDVHGHGHKLQRAELGYLISGKVLDSGAVIDPNQTSIRHLANKFKSINFNQLLRGRDSFGYFLEMRNFDSVPSPKFSGPGGNIYFDGGFNTRRHGSRDGGWVDAFQIESARSFREMPLRAAYSKAVACSIWEYMCQYYYQPATEASIMNDICQKSQSGVTLCSKSHSSQSHPSILNSWISVAVFYSLIEFNLLSSFFPALSNFPGPH